ncbi:MAG: hypothetical protein IT204_09375 [Fimbriimonadaceae bacterium]|nr:hypothetical protein [Fimbriimonadaceae bacterium]
MKAAIRWARRALLLGLLATWPAAAQLDTVPPQRPAGGLIRAALVWPTGAPGGGPAADLTTPARCDALIERAAALHLTRLYVFTTSPGGYGWPRSPQFDALDGLCRAAAARRIEVYAWCAVTAGEVPAELAAQGLDGRPLAQASLANAAFRKHYAGLVAELVGRYAVHGVLLDWLQQPGEGGDQADWSLAAREAFRAATGAELERAVPPDFPCTGRLAGHLLEHPTTARVLLRRGTGQPVILWNRLEQGEVVVICASERLTVRALGAALRKAVAPLDGSGRVLVLTPPPGSPAHLQPRLQHSLEGLGLEPRWQPSLVDALNRLSAEPQQRLLLPWSHQRYHAAEVAALRTAVDEGNRIVFLNPPVGSLDTAGLPELLGAHGGAVFDEPEVTLLPVGAHSLVPSSGASEPALERTELWRAWQQLRTTQVTACLAELRQALLRSRPDLAIEAVVPGPWRDVDRGIDTGAWLAQGLVEHVVAGPWQATPPDRLVGPAAQVVAPLGTWQPLTDPAALPALAARLLERGVAGLVLSPAQLLELPEPALPQVAVGPFGPPLAPPAAP